MNQPGNPPDKHADDQEDNGTKTRRVSVQHPFAEIRHVPHRQTVVCAFNGNIFRLSALYGFDFISDGVGNRKCRVARLAMGITGGEIESLAGQFRSAVGTMQRNFRVKRFHTAEKRFHPVAPAITCAPGFH